MRFEDPAMEADFHSFSAGMQRWPLILVGCALALQLILTALRFTQVLVVVQPVYWLVYLPLGVAVVHFAAAMALRAHPRLLGRFSRPPHELLLGCLLSMSAAILATAVVMIRAAHEPLLLVETQCVVPLLIFMHLMLLCVPWSTALAVGCGAAVLLVWITLALVYTVPALETFSAADRDTVMRLAFTICGVLWASGSLAASSIFFERERRSEYLGRLRALSERREAAANEAEAEAKSKAVSHISHELRTPLNSIVLCAELLKGTALDNTQQRYMDNIVAAGQQLLSLVNDILDYAKLQAGELVLKSAPIVVKVHGVGGGAMGNGLTAEAGLDRVVAGDGVPAGQRQGPGAVLLVRRACAGHHLWRLPPLVAGSHQPPHQWNQVHRPRFGWPFASADRLTAPLPGAVFVDVEVDQARLRFTVGDTGIGIAEADLGLVFQRFKQLDAGPTRRLQSGTGLGLAICKELVTLMGGEIGVRSREGEGSRFWFTVPLPTVSTAALAVAQAAAAEDAEPLARKQKLLVLVLYTNVLFDQQLRSLLHVRPRCCEMGEAAGRSLLASQASHHASALFPTCEEELATMFASVSARPDVVLVEGGMQDAETLLRVARVLRVTYGPCTRLVLCTWPTGPPTFPLSALSLSPISRQTHSVCLRAIISMRCCTRYAAFPGRPPCSHCASSRFVARRSRRCSTTWPWIKRCPPLRAPPATRTRRTRTHARVAPRRSRNW